MWFALISIMGMGLLGPFEDSLACHAALDQAMQDRPAFRYADGDHKPEALGVCFRSGDWRRENRE